MCPESVCIRLFRPAAVGVGFRPGDDQIAGIEIGGAAVLQGGIQQPQHGVHVGVGVDGRSVFPGAGGV